MSEVFREVSFLWGEAECALVPSVALLRRIKAQGVNHMSLAKECIHGGADPLDLVVVLRAFLGAGGITASEDQCYAFLTGGDAKAIASFQMAYISAVLPSVDLGKKPEAPALSPTKPVAKKKRAT